VKESQVASLPTAPITSVIQHSHIVDKEFTMLFYNVLLMSEDLYDHHVSKYKIVMSQKISAHTLEDIHQAKYFEPNHV
jgi:hypothetical protein